MIIDIHDALILAHGTVAILSQTILHKTASIVIYAAIFTVAAFVWPRYGAAAEIRDSRISLLLPMHSILALLHGGKVGVCSSSCVVQAGLSLCLVPGIHYARGQIRWSHGRLVMADILCFILALLLPGSVPAALHAALLATTMFILRSFTTGRRADDVSLQTGPLLAAIMISVYSTLELVGPAIASWMLMAIFLFIGCTGIVAPRFRARKVSSNNAHGL